MDTIKNTKVSFNIVLITDNDKEVVINSLKQYFFRDEPLCASSGLMEEKESVIQLENFCVDLLRNGEFIDTNCKQYIFNKYMLLPTIVYLQIRYYYM